MAFVVFALLGCGEDASRSEGTDDTTRSLLGGSVMGGGPSTVVRGMPGLTDGTEEVNVLDFGYNRGSPDAILKVIEFSDFGCGYCLRFHQESFPTLKEQFIDTGMIEWKFMPFITGAFENSLEVTEAAECALEQSPALYEELGGVLWARQREWKESDEPAALVRGWADEAGVDLARFDSCLAEDRRMRRITGANGIASRLLRYLAWRIALLSQASACPSSSASAWSKSASAWATAPRLR